MNTIINELKSELRIQYSRISTWVTILLFEVLCIYFYTLTKNELLFLRNIDGSWKEKSTTINFPPILDSILLSSILFGCTIFIIIGVLSITYEYSLHTSWIRGCTSHWTIVLMAKCLAKFIMILFTTCLILLNGFITQYIFNLQYPDLAFSLTNLNFSLLLHKIIALSSMLLVSSCIGIIIGTLIKKSNVSIFVSLVIDQVFMPKTWLYTYYLNSEFNNIHLKTIQGPQNTITRIPYFQTLLILFLFILVLIGCIHLISQKKGVSY